MSILDRALRIGETKKFRTFEKQVARINDLESEYELLEDHEIKEEMDELRRRARGGESLDDLLYESFALTREAGKRALGLRPFSLQMVGGMVHHAASIAETKPGGSMALTASLAVVLNPLRGKGVPLVTVTDCLARRDAEWMKPIY